MQYANDLFKRGRRSSTVRVTIASIKAVVELLQGKLETEGKALKLLFKGM